jgi:hypothetical protein
VDDSSVAVIAEVACRGETDAVVMVEDASDDEEEEEKEEAAAAAAACVADTPP